MNTLLQPRRRHLLRWIVIAGGGVAAVLVVIVLVWFQPQKLFFDDHVSEAAPLLAPPARSETAAEGSQNQATTPPEPLATTAAGGTIATGSFRSLEHKTTGQASVLQLSDGSRILRFEDLDTSNGPDLRVILSSAPSSAGDKDFGDDYVELGKLKGNIGDQNYEVPAGIDLGRYSSAVVWCHRFKVGFGVAGLT
jgi:hypothetical protein